MKNFHFAYIEGSSNVKCPIFKEHADSEMHKRAVCVQRKSQDTVIMIINDVPIVQSLASFTMDKVALERTFKSLMLHILLLRKAYVAFTNMKSICEQKKRTADLE